MLNPKMISCPSQSVKAEMLTNPALAKVAASA